MLALIFLNNPLSSCMWTVIWSFYTTGELCALYSGLPNYSTSPEIIHGGAFYLITTNYSTYIDCMPNGLIATYILFRPEVYILVNYLLHKGCLS